MRIQVLIIFLLMLSDCFADSWTQKASITGQRDGAVAFSIGNKGYVGTGYNSGAGAYYKDFWEYDPLSGTWTQKADFGGGNRFAGIGFSIGIKGYIGTGLSNTGYKNDFWEWDQGSNTWIQKANLPAPGRNSAIGFSIGLKGYIATGGINPPLTLYKDYWEWDGDTSSTTYNTWVQKADLVGGSRAGATGFSIGTKGYIGMGVNGGSFANVLMDFWEWESVSNTWTQKANIEGSRAGALGFVIGPKGYVGTGSDSVGQNKKDFWEYDPTPDSWVRKMDFGGAPRNGTIGFSIGNKGYIGMGFFFTVSTNDFWEYCDTCTIGIEEFNNSLSVEVFPNPAIDKLTIFTNQYYNYLRAELFNILGKKVFEKEYKNINSSFQIEISHYKEGVYFLKLNDNTNSLTKRIVVQR